MARISMFRLKSLFFATLFVVFALQPQIAHAAGPSLITAVVEPTSGRTITLTFDDLSGSTTNPLRLDFSVSGANQGIIPVSFVSRSENALRISVTDVLAIGQVITLTYAPTTNIPSNASGELLAGFTAPLTHLGATLVPVFMFPELSFNASNLSQIYLTSNSQVTCSLRSSNFQVKVNGVNRAVSSVQGCSTISIYLSSPIVANDQVTLSYTPSAGSITSIFGVAAAAFTDAKVWGVPDTIAPSLSIPATSSHQFGLGGNIPVVTNEPAGFVISTDRTLSFQINSTGKPNEVVLLVSSILPVGTYIVGVTATDESGNATSRNITVNITSSNPTPTPTPIATPIATPKPTATTPVTQKSTVYKTCLLLNKKYPGGVATSYSARNKGAGMNYIPRVDAAAYKANIKLDKDKDGIVCER
jgi:uncharacterized repeat protein (TIGR02059 family)